MIGWRRRAKADRESTVSPERLSELVSQTLMENFGPLGSFAITRRTAADTDDIFHTALARSVAHDIVTNLAEHGIAVRSTVGHASTNPLAPVDAVPVPARLERAVSAAMRPVAVPAVRPVPLPAMPPAVAPDVLDDDALRSLVAHHADVTRAAERNRAASDSGPLRDIAI
jgi:hypothetical protein